MDTPAEEQEIDWYAKFKGEKSRSARWRVIKIGKDLSNTFMFLFINLFYF